MKKSCGGVKSVSLRPILSTIISGFRLSNGKKSTTPKVKTTTKRNVRPVKKQVIKAKLTKAIPANNKKIKKIAATKAVMPNKMKMKGGAQADFFE
jgi:hypothetical protein